VEHVLIVGFGLMGQRIASLALARGYQVDSCNRKGATLEGVRHYSADLDAPDTLNQLPTRGARVIYLAPPPGGGHQETRVRNFCDSIAPGEEPAKIVYISTSAVYGDCQGGVVTEETVPDPQNARGKRRLHGEELFSAWGKERGVPVVILRVSGIYAQDRLPFMQLESGQPVLREEEALPTNRIHADDLAAVCLAALERGRDGAIFNVSDGSPSTMTRYFNAAADYLGLPRPPQVSREEARQVMSPLMISYFSESRILDNRRMLEELGITLQYPDLETALKK
jgi:nucleoside-diphosphate-sugar epimerase